MKQHVYGSPGPPYGRTVGKDVVSRAVVNADSLAETVLTFCKDTSFSPAAWAHWYWGVMSTLAERLYRKMATEVEKEVQMGEADEETWA